MNLNYISVSTQKVQWFVYLLQQTNISYDSRRSSISSVVSSASWANKRSRLLYTPLILVNEVGGTQAMWGDTNGSASLPASAHPGWIGSGMTGVAQQPRAYTTLRVPSQNSPGYMERGSADSLVESVNVLSECCSKYHFTWKQVIRIAVIRAVTVAIKLFKPDFILICSSEA